MQTGVEIGVAHLRDREQALDAPGMLHEAQEEQVVDEAGHTVGGGVHDAADRVARL